MQPHITQNQQVQELRDLWTALTEEEQLEAFRRLPHDEAEEFFLALDAIEQAHVLLQLPPNEARAWLRLLPPDDTVDILQEVAAEHRPSLEVLLDDVTLRETRALLAYAEDEAGGLMSPRFVRLRPDVPVEVAIRYLRLQTQRDMETIYYIYVLDQEQKILGVVSFRELFAAPNDALVQDIMSGDVVTVHENTDQESVARTMARHDLLAIPVIDDQSRMQGIITIDDIVDVQREEATEDIQKMGAVESLDAPYLQVPILTMLRKRAGWLSILLVGGMLTASAMSHFESQISQAVILAVFIPLIIASGGNSGSQASTLVVRALALNELKLRDWYRVLFRELTTGAILGFWLGFLGFLRVVLWQELNLFDHGEHYLQLGLVVWISLLGIVTFGSVIGSMLPLILRRVGFDPATSSAPFVATLVDVSGLYIYFLVALFLLSGTIL